MKSEQQMWYNKYKNIGDGNPLNSAQNIIIENEDTNIPLNLPTFLIGSKNAGKSTLINTIINASSSNNIYKNIIYIYTDNVDSTLAECCHTLLTRVPLRSSIKYLSEYLYAKTQFHSWINFLNKNNITLNNIDAVLHDPLYESDPYTLIKKLLQNYIDNVIDEYVRVYILNKQTNPESKLTRTEREFKEQYKKCFGPLVDQLRDKNKTLSQHYENPVLSLINHAIEYIIKYSKPFSIIIDDVVYNVDGFRVDDYDLIVIDDVALAAESLFPERQQRSPIYPFLTVSRHVLCGWIIAGQDTMQLPKYARKEINTFIIGYGINIDDLKKNTHIPNDKAKEIIKNYPNLKQHDFICYNGVNNTLTDMLMSEQSIKEGTTTDKNEDNKKNKNKNIKDEINDKINKI